MEQLGKIEVELRALKANLSTKPEQEVTKISILQKKGTSVITQDVLKSDESVKFYLGIPYLACFTFLKLNNLTNKKMCRRKGLVKSVIYNSKRSLF